MGISCPAAQYMCHILSKCHMLEHTPYKEEDIMNRYKCYQSPKDDPQYDDNTCKRYRPVESCCESQAYCYCNVCPSGPQGPAGGVLNYADFYALMPPDNAATVAPGTDVSFPQDGPNSGSGIVRSGPDSFTLAEIGTYQVLFQVSVTEPGQLILTLNGEDLAYTVAGRATGTSQIVGMAIVETTVINSVLTVRNPEGTAAALTITPLAGGTRPVSAHLVITQIQ